MKAQYKDIAAQIDNLIEKWEKALDMRWVTVNHAFIEAYHEEDHNTIADTEAYWQYRHAKIRWFLPKALSLSALELEIALIHEYVHILLCPIESKLPAKHSELSEFAVESIALAIMNAANVNIAGRKT